MDFATASADILKAAIQLATLGALVAVGRFAWKGIRILSVVAEYVIPHFRPPTVEEQLSGVEDNTVPARVRRLETAHAEHRADDDTRFEAQYRVNRRVFAALSKKADAAT